MVIVLGDLIADLAMRIPNFPVNAQDLKPISYLEIGPGGATNIAIMAARFGLPVACLGEVGRDAFGESVLNGLQREGIETRHVITNPETKTPVAGVLVDKQREPAYLGYRGNLTVRKFPDAWLEPIKHADALFADGWVEIPEMPQMILDAFEMAQRAGVKIFFDPGPGNPAFDLQWHARAAELATVLLVNEEEAQRLAQTDDAAAAAQTLVQRGAQLVVLKRGAHGMMLCTAEQKISVPGFQVDAVDLTGAGDSVTGAILYGYLNKMELRALGVLGNATGARKVQKLGTGHNMPTRDEIRATLARFAPAFADLV
jgi:sugar/nucleoside kinase (ribokinase family)